MQPQGFTRALYAKSVPPTNEANRYRTVQGYKTGKRGRPSGTYDQRYAAYGGVYGFRKYQATQLKIARMEALRRTAVTPQQQAVLAQIEARRQAQLQSPERRVIPDTRGDVFMDDIMREIDAASNAVR